MTRIGFAGAPRGRAAAGLRGLLLALALLAAVPDRVHAQDSDDAAPSGQAWGDFRLVWPDQEEEWLFRLDLPPLVQFSGDQKWAQFAVVPAAVYQAPLVVN